MKDNVGVSVQYVGAELLEIERVQHSVCLRESRDVDSYGCHLSTIAPSHLLRNVAMPSISHSLCSEQH